MKSITLLSAALLILSTAGVAAPGERACPQPLSGHPGNVFLAGEEVAFSVASAGSEQWQVMDYADREVAVIAASEGRVNLGRLPVGFYRLRPQGQRHWISCAVLSPLQAPTPTRSPIGLDVAMAWFYPKEKMDAVASLCALAGVNWVRDRLAWGQMEPRRGEFAGANRYDDSAAAQSDAGLQVLQVNHSSPDWANPNHKRFPLDLRDAYRFHREMAKRWRGQVLAFEPWNEADIPNFGGHTGSEMAAMQKASYLGLKAGNPDVIACLNVFAAHNRFQLEDLHENEAWPYFETFNLHHYAPFDSYPKLYADFRAVSAGRPLWVTECAVPVKWAGDERLKEPTDADLRVQSERIAKVFVGSLHEGAEATFYFLLPHYVEGQTQFGLLRPDLTPRPGYVALAAVGRLLADAKPLGRLRTPDTVRAFLFRAAPDGHRRDVLVAWTTPGPADLALPAHPLQVFDHLGRNLAASRNLNLGSAPVFAILSAGTMPPSQVEPPPKTPARLSGQPSPVVLQALWPESKLALGNSAYRLSSEKAEAVPLFVYNFSDAPVTGHLTVSAPIGWKASGFGELKIAPQSRAELALELDCRDGGPRLTETVRVTGDFGSAGKPILSMRVMPEPTLLVRQAGTPVAGAEDASRWQRMISGDGTMKIGSSNGGVLIEAEPLGSDRWVYPRLPVGEQQPPAGCQALCFTLTLLEGDGFFRAIFDEENGSSYTVNLLAQPEPGQTVEAVALLDNAAHGVGWSKPDPNHQLDPDKIRSLKIGCNTKSERVRFAFKNLRWVP